MQTRVLTFWVSNGDEAMGWQGGFFEFRPVREQVKRIDASFDQMKRPWKV